MGTRVEYLDRQYHPPTRRYPPPAKTSHTNKPPAIKFTVLPPLSLLLSKQRRIIVSILKQKAIYCKGCIKAYDDHWPNTNLISSDRTEKGAFQQEAKLLRHFLGGDHKRPPTDRRLVTKTRERSGRHLEVSC